MGKSTNSENDCSFSITFNLSSGVIISTIFVLTSFVVIGTVLGEWKGVADKLSDLGIGLLIVSIGVPIAMKINRQNRKEEQREEVRDFCIGMQNYLIRCVEQIDLSVHGLIHDFRPMFSPDLEFFERAEWSKRYALITDTDLIRTMEGLKHSVNQYLRLFESLEQGPIPADDLLLFVFLSIGTERYEQIKAIPFEPD